MIDMSALCSDLEKKLVAHAATERYDRTIKIYDELGDRIPNEFIDDTDIPANYIFGIFTASPSQLSPIEGLTIVQTYATVTFSVDIHKSAKDDKGNYIEVENLKNVINSFAQSQNAESGSGFLIYYSLASVGDTVIVSSEYGECVPVAFSVFYTYAENGFLASDMQLYIDGIKMPYISCEKTYRRTFEGALSEGNTRLKVVNTDGAVGVDFTTPLIGQGSFQNSSLFLDEEKKNINTAHAVELKYKNGQTYGYVMSFSVITLSGKPPELVGVTASLTEILDKTVTNFVREVYSADVDAWAYTKISTPGFVDWGDHTVTVFQANTSELYHKYKQEGYYTIRVYDLG